MTIQQDITSLSIQFLSRNHQAVVKTIPINKDITSIGRIYLNIWLLILRIGLLRTLIFRTNSSSLQQVPIDMIPNIQQKASTMSFTIEVKNTPSTPITKALTKTNIRIVYPIVTP